MSEATQEQKTQSDTDKRAAENKAVYVHIRGLIEVAYGHLRTVDWEGLMALLEPAAEHDAGEAIPMFRTVRDFVRAFVATKQGADLEARYARDERKVQELSKAIEGIFGHQGAGNE